MTARRWGRTIATLAVVVAPTLISARQDADNRVARTYARAIELESQGNQPAALSLLWQAAGLAPRDADIQNRLGEALERIGALDAAVAAYRQALSARPDFRKASNNLILALGKAGHGEEAVERAQALVALAPDDPDRHFSLGLAQSEVNVAGAIESFRRVLTLAPRHVLARYNLALALKRTDRMGDAIEELERAIAIEPRPEAHYARGVIYWHLGDLDRAARALRDAVAAEPRYADAYSTLGSVLRGKGDSRGAAAALRRAIALAPDQPASHYTLAQVLRLTGDERGARNELADAERLRKRVQSEQEATMWTSTGIQKLDAGDFAGALDLFQRATAVNDRYAPAYYQTGRALQGLGRHDAARQAFAKAAELNPSLAPPGEPNLSESQS